MRFGYLRDPVFLVCFITYLVNRFGLKEAWDAGFVHDYLNDLICIPMLVPIILYAERKTGLRRHDDIPQWYEVIFPLLIWSIVFEIVLPDQPKSGTPVVADHRDIFCYALGGFIAVLFWRIWYRPNPALSTSPTAHRAMAPSERRP